MIKNSYHILEQVYGYRDFRPVQKEIIDHVLSGKDALALLPTGGGKSICYQIPGMMLNGLCVVISPLIALIKDQVEQLQQRGVKVIGLTGGISHNDLSDLLDNCVYGNYQFLYLSPERLRNDLVRDRLKNIKISLIAVDEAHCISQWGHDFRPAYRLINEFRATLQNVPLLAVTATATKKVKEDILENLKINRNAVFMSSFARPNLSYILENTPDKRTALLQFYKEHEGSSIVYVRSRKNATYFADLLNQSQITASYYHGGLPLKVRAKTSALWLKDQCQVMVATNAFGMGIDKPNVRSVIHVQMPESIESYYQETGRAGRDGMESIALFIFNINDTTHARNQFLSASATSQSVKHIYKKLCVYLQIPLGEGVDTTHHFSFAHFCNTYNLDGTLCYNALQTLDRFSVIALSQGFERRSTVRFRESGKNITQFAGNNEVLNAIIQSILRTYGGSINHTIEVNIALIAQRSKTSEEQVIQALTTLKDKDYIDAAIVNADTQITLLQPRDDDRTINAFSKELDLQNTYKKEKLNALIALVTDSKQCLNKLLLAYFDEKSIENCGKCSNCLKLQKTTKSQDCTAAILNILAQNPETLENLQIQLQIPMTEITSSIKKLMDMSVVGLTHSNTYTLL